MKLIVWSTIRSVTGEEPNPCTLATLLNQTESLAGIAVPLKFEAMEERVERTTRSSIISSNGRRRDAVREPGPRRPRISRNPLWFEEWYNSEK